MTLELCKDLLDKKLEDVISYVNNYEQYVSKWIENNVVYFCHKEKCLDNALMQSFLMETQDIISCVQQATKQISKKHLQNSTKAWWSNLKTELKKKPFEQVIQDVID